MNAIPVTCEHDVIVVTYLHPYGSNFHNQSLADLLVAVSAGRLRPVVTVKSPKCVTCGKALAEDELSQRISPGGDLYDDRLVWVW